MCYFNPDSRSTPSSVIQLQIQTASLCFCGVATWDRKAAGTPLPSSALLVHSLLSPDLAISGGSSHVVCLALEMFPAAQTFSLMWTEKSAAWPGLSLIHPNVLASQSVLQMKHLPLKKHVSLPVIKCPHSEGERQEEHRFAPFSGLRVVVPWISTHEALHTMVGGPPKTSVICSNS